jgi:hypothetical protein
VFSVGYPVVKEADSDFDTQAKAFADTGALQEHVTSSISRNKGFFHFALYYPESKGVVREKRIELKPGSVPSHTHRYKQEGWGLIYLQINFRDHLRIECRVAVNSAERANVWAVNYPELGPPNAWDWTVVNQHARRLVGLLRKLAKESIVNPTAH